MRFAACLFLLTSFVAPAHAAKDPQVYNVVLDNFKKGFSEARWPYFTFGPYVGNDGVVTKAKGGGITVTAKGKNARTGEPAFTLTAGQDVSVPGDIDHVKWLAFANNASSKGYPGFDTAPGYITSCETRLSGRTYGTAQHAFGPSESSTDPNLAFIGAINGDFEKFMIFDFAVTNDAIYALYERLPFGRTAENHYASFTHLIKVAYRNMADEHVLKVSYDRTAKTVEWFVDGRSVFKVTKIGYYLENRSVLAIDRGGVEEDVGTLNQLVCGFGMFTLMDGFNSRLNKGLVELVGQDGYYRQPLTRGALSFVDSKSAASSRLFGQGAEMTVKSVSVSSVKKSIGNAQGNQNQNQQ